MTGERVNGGHGTVGQEELLALVYDELRALAAKYLRHEPTGHTLQPTALVHEAYLRLGGLGGDFNGRVHFIGAAATMMRRVLIDHAKARRSLKRGGDRARLDLTMAALLDDDGGATPIDILALDEALERLAHLAPRHARVVELRFFGGLSNADVAEVLGCSVRTVESDWRSARAWLHRELAQAE